MNKTQVTIDGKTYFADIQKAIFLGVLSEVNFTPEDIVAGQRVKYKDNGEEIATIVQTSFNPRLFRLGGAYGNSHICYIGPDRTAEAMAAHLSNGYSKI